MTIRAILAGAALLTLAAPPPPAFAAQADDGQTVLEPLAPWQLDLGENNCRLARTFGTEDRKTLLLFEQWDPSTSVSWLVAGDAVKTYKSRRSASFAFGPDGDAEQFDYLPSTFGDFGTVVRSVSSIVSHEGALEAQEEGEWNPSYNASNPRGLPHLDADGAEGITFLDIGRSKADDVRLNLGDMKKPLEAMNLCMANLVEHWGFDVARQREVVRQPNFLNPNAVVSQIIRNYPSKALRKGAQADFHLRLSIGAGGSVEKCALINQTLAEEFDMRRHPCTIFSENAQFTPATDAAGTAIPTYFVTRILYRIPG